MIALDSKERLLDDGLTEALPVWSPDASKVSTAFDTDVMIYDAAGNEPTQARIRLYDAVMAASRVFEEKNSANNGAASAIPASFNPIIRLEWTSPETLFFETAYLRLTPGEPTTIFQRWHLVILSRRQPC